MLSSDVSCCLLRKITACNKIILRERERERERKKRERDREKREQKAGIGGACRGMTT
jgi:hypothetical protein